MPHAGFSSKAKSFKTIALFCSKAGTPFIPVKAGIRKNTIQKQLDPGLCPTPRGLAGMTNCDTG
jgi:hypothetical protein